MKSYSLLSPVNGLSNHLCTVKQNSSVYLQESFKVPLYFWFPFLKKKIQRKIGLLSCSSAQQVSWLAE